MTTIIVEVDDETEKWLTEHSVSLGITVSQLALELIKDYLDSRVKSAVSTVVEE